MNETYQKYIKLSNKKAGNLCRTPPRQSLKGVCDDSSLAAD